MTTVPRSGWYNVATIDGRSRILEVFMQVIDVFRHSILQVTRDRDVIPDSKMLNILTQSNTTSMWTDRNCGWMTELVVSWLIILVKIVGNNDYNYRIIQTN